MPSVAPHRHRAPWQEQLAACARDPEALALELGWGEESAVRLARAAKAFPFRATAHYLALADPEDPLDPILRQVLPHPDELRVVPGFTRDAVGDGQARRSAGLVHKYPGRALLVTTGACAVNCRFCFRRHFPYEELAADGPGLTRAVAAVEQDPSIHEVILSGGDPLSLPDRPLLRLVQRLADIPHVRRLRVHSRMPVVLPDRVTDALVQGLAGCGKAVWFVAHFNHPRELHPDAVEACARLRRVGVPVLNQAVLLAGVNDDERVLAELLEGLVDAGIKPYYLHQLDRVAGVAHFDVPEDRARSLMESLRARVSGLAMPAWVRDVPGRLSKTPLAVLLSVAMLTGCGRAEPGPRPDIEGADRQASLGDVSARDVRAKPKLLRVPPLPEGAAPLPQVDRLLAADLDGDGRRELLQAHERTVRWGAWPEGATVPSQERELQGEGVLQAWVALDLDGDGADEVIAGFGVGRGFADAPLQLILLDHEGGELHWRQLWKDDGERNQVTALLPWKVGGRPAVYVAAFETRFVVRGGELTLDGGPLWLPGHSLRMGMARATGDFDGDGELEVAIGRLYGEDVDQPGDLRVLDGQTTVPIPTLRGVRAVGAGDLDGDGRDELLFGDGWHKQYGKMARFRPHVARFGEGGWTVELVEQRADQYAVESLAVDGSRLLVGGNRSAHVYERGDEGWKPLGQPEPVAITGAVAGLGGGRYAASGARLRLFRR